MIWTVPTCCFRPPIPEPPNLPLLPRIPLLLLALFAACVLLASLVTVDSAGPDSRIGDVLFPCRKSRNTSNEVSATESAVALNAFCGIPPMRICIISLVVPPNSGICEANQLTTFPIDTSAA